MKKIKIYKKKINGLEVDYFECQLKYNDYNYNYQGFIYNGKAGAVALQFGVQAEGLPAYQNLIDSFCDGFTEVR